MRSLQREVLRVDVGVKLYMNHDLCFFYYVQNLLMLICRFEWFSQSFSAFCKYVNRCFAWNMSSVSDTLSAVFNTHNFGVLLFVVASKWVKVEDFSRLVFRHFSLNSGPNKHKVFAKLNNFHAKLEHILT